MCRHGFGYSVFEHFESGIASELFTYVAMDAPVKFVVVKLHNQSKRARSLSLTGYWELVLGEWRHANLMHIVTETDPHSGALFARNAYGRECANRVVFAQVSERERSRDAATAPSSSAATASLASPAAMRRKRLSGRAGAGLDPCAAIQARIELAEGQEREIVFVFGAAGNTDEAQQLIQRFGGRAGARQALEAVWEYWNRTLGAVHVETPDPALNVLVNGWLVYQTLSCRFWGRSGYYQSGGAYGFRDQLQDTMALIHAAPWLAREQLIRCAGRQFLEGDVQHWWHPPNGQGVRTHFSDDYLWLPYAACRYVAATGDTGVLDEPVHFLEGRALNPEEEAYYDQPQRSPEVASLYEHCVRAIKHGLRFGAHQLPLMGCGDWNDGMNLRRSRGQGRKRVAGVVPGREPAAVRRPGAQPGRRSLCRRMQRAGGAAAHKHRDACLGRRLVPARLFRRRHAAGLVRQRGMPDRFDQPELGGHLGRRRPRSAPARRWTAVDQRLVRRDAQLIQLLDPPFDTSDLEPGYIKGYVPGVRENGGQYTHAAIWASMAFAMMGDT